MKKDMKKKEESKFTVMEVKTKNEMTIVVKGEEGRNYRFVMPFYSPLPELIPL